VAGGIPFLAISCFEPVAAIIANAVYDVTGVCIRELPITAERVRRGHRARFWGATARRLVFSFEFQD
jgi:hypothetical protein